MREVLQVRFGEIFLKGLNRPTFMRMLVSRVRDAVREVQGHVWLSDSRVYVSDMTDMDEAIRRVTKVFGVHSVCRAIEMEKDSFEAIFPFCKPFSYPHRSSRKYESPSDAGG